MGWALEISSRASTKYSRIQQLKCRLRIDSGEHNKPIQLGVQALENFDIWPYKMGIRAYYKFDFKYFNPLAYDSITKIALFWLKKNKKNSIDFVEITHSELIIKNVDSGTPSGLGALKLKLY